MLTLHPFVSLRRRAVALVAAILLAAMIAAPAAAAVDIAIPLVTNGRFELPGDGPTRSSAVGMQAPTAAAGWSTWNNDPVETATDLVPSTLPGYGGGMLHVTVAGTRLVNGSGVYRPYAAVDTGPTAVRAQVWLYVVNGQVGIGTGNGGHTGIDAVTSTTGRWQLLTAVNGVRPVNEVIIYAINQSAEFYIGAVTVTSTPSPYGSTTAPGRFIRRLAAD